MSDTVIRVENLGKEYRLGKREGYRTLRDSISETAAAAWNRLTGRRSAAPADDSTFWALRDVSFDIKQGEVVGVIGRNGAGKSTLLKILSQITEPTTGRIELTGRVGSLLEVGTGFHPELTGRENIYLNGAILGMKRTEITCKFDEIVAFAEVERFIDTAVKHYSSGMYMRLAFAVAAHLEPEILIVDEVLAVGDAEFQKKCLGKMGEVAKGGRTVLFVSHNLTAIRQLCTKAILLRTGQVELDSDVHEALTCYLALANGNETDWEDTRENDSKAIARLTRICLLGEGTIPASSPIHFEIGYSVLEPTLCQISFRLNLSDGTTVLTTADGDVNYIKCRARLPGTYRVRVKIPGNLLAPGRYHLMVAICDVNSIIDQRDRVLNFEIDSVGSLRQLDHRWGTVLPVLDWVEQ